MTERLDSGEYDAFLLSWIADSSDPMAFLSGFGEDSGTHYFRFRDARVHRMLNEAEHELEPRRRGARFREVERYVLQAAPFVPLYHTRGVLAASHTVNGLRPGPFGVARLELERVWLEAEGSAS
jgi:peptide/nickel transport system substrate-binding protein